MQNITLFYLQEDENGVCNRERIASWQKIIRRVATTDKSRSYEESSGSSDGIVLENGKLIGFGIHIFNKDIYPLQSFEIYLRGCDQTGVLDLSGQKDLLFVDVYHNRISEVRVNSAQSGARRIQRFNTMKSMRIRLQPVRSGPIWRRSAAVSWPIWRKAPAFWILAAAS